MSHAPFTLFFKELANDKVPVVGGKNASLGELFTHLTPAGINVPNGFATTAEAYWRFLDENHLRAPLAAILGRLDQQEFTNLAEVGEQARALLHGGALPIAVALAITTAYQQLSPDLKHPTPVAVRSSATAEDLPRASFAGQHDSFLNVRGPEAVLAACQACYVSLFNDRAIKYRVQHKFDHLQVALSVGVQTMVRADVGAAGVAFTIEPETGHEHFVYLTSSWGLGENVVQGAVNPDEFYLFKPSLRTGHRALITKKLGDKARTLRYAPDERTGGTQNTDTPPGQRALFSLTNAEAERLGRWCLLIEEHYKMPMDVEWAKEGVSNELYIVQARPETIHHGRRALCLHAYKLLQKGPLLATGQAVGSQIATGVARLLASPADGHRLQPG